MKAPVFLIVAIAPLSAALVPQAAKAFDENSPISIEREEMHSWWCADQHHQGTTLCEVWEFKNLLIETHGEIAKTRRPPDMSAPDHEEHREMHSAYCESHDAESPLCKRLFRKKKHANKKRSMWSTLFGIEL